MTYALNCKTGRFITIRHNRVRDFEAQLLIEIRNDVEIEPPLQPLEGEISTVLLVLMQKLMYVLIDFGEKVKMPS